MYPKYLFSYFSAEFYLKNQYKHIYEKKIIVLNKYTKLRMQPSYEF